jgi:type IV pilus assembly protein PilE
MKKTVQFGFSLIELMVVVAILGIIAAIAYPSYNNSVLKGRRAEAQVALLDLLQQQERYMTQRNTYLVFATDNAGKKTPSDAPFKEFSGDSASAAHYFLSAQACDGGLPVTECIRLTATPRKEDKETGTLRITSTGTKDCTGTKPEMCWK